MTNYGRRVYGTLKSNIEEESRKKPTPNYRRRVKETLNPVEKKSRRNPKPNYRRR